MSEVEPKMVGRLLKKGSVLVKKVRVTNYSLAEIRENPVVYSDNADRNVIHSELHDKSELVEGVRGYPGLDQELIDSSIQAAVPFPRNFTKDWLRDKSKAKRKARSIFDDEEDEDDFEQGEFQEVAPGQEETPVQNAGGDQSSRVSSQDGADSLQNPNQNEAEFVGKTVESDRSFVEGQLDSNSDSESLADLQKASVDDSFQVVGNAIKEMGTAAIADHQPSVIEERRGDSRPFSELSDQAAGKPDLDSTQGSEQVAGQDADLSTLQPSDGFVQTDTAGVEEGIAVEDSAIAEYQKQKVMEEIDTEGIKAEAKARGYEEGFRSGEERATIQYHQKSEELFQNIKELMEEFSNLKTDILDNVQANFFELSQAMCESLVGRSIDMEPEIFADIMRRAISEAVDGDSFKIVVSPKMTELLDKLDLADLRGNIKADASMDDRDFRIESKLGVVDSGISKIISDLLEEANIQLFNTENKAG